MRRGQRVWLLEPLRSDPLFRGPDTAQDLHVIWNIVFPVLFAVVDCFSTGLTSVVWIAILGLVRCALLWLVINGVERTIQRGISRKFFHVLQRLQV